MQLAKLGNWRRPFKKVAKQVNGASGRLGGLAGRGKRCVCGWGWVNAGKVAKPLTVPCPSAKVALCTSCKTGYDRRKWDPRELIGLSEVPTAAFTVKKGNGGRAWCRQQQLNDPQPSKS